MLCQFVALQDASTDDCVSLARALGQAVAARFAVPVYLYADATTRPERRALENIRRGQLEGLASRMHEEAWHPDFGPEAPHPTAGVSAIGARGPLIAFNINLDTDDLEIAQQIARTIRERSGGLPFVKAIGVRSTDRPWVQVSMNLTRPGYTPIDRVFDLVKREAAKRGAGITSSEIVGLRVDHRADRHRSALPAIGHVHTGPGARGAALPSDESSSPSVFLAGMNPKGPHLAVQIAPFNPSASAVRVMFPRCAAVHERCSLARTALVPPVAVASALPTLTPG